jgi:hypothetical protein
MNEGTVYVIQAGAHYKIGRTQYLEHRLSMLQGECPTPIRLIYWLETADSDRLERAIHHHCRDRRLHGEWFRLQASELALLAVHFGLRPGTERGRLPHHRLKPVTCLRCGYHWTPYVGKRPTRCARCQSPYWDQPRTKGLPKPEGTEDAP